MAKRLLTPSDVHLVADAQGVPWDGDKVFMALSTRMTGKSHLDDMTQAELKKMVDILRQGPSEKVAATRQVEELRKLYAGAQEPSERAMALEQRLDHLQGNRADALRAQGLVPSTSLMNTRHIRGVTRQLDQAHGTPLDWGAISANREKLTNLAGQLHASGAQKDSPGGIQPSRQFWNYPRGEEVLASPVIGPQGMEVRKHFDQQARLNSPQIRADKATLFRAEHAAGQPVAELYKEVEQPGLAIHRMEHVPGRTRVGAKNVLPLMDGLNRVARDTGFGHVADVANPDTGRYNAGNTKMTPDGQLKVIDLLPGHHVDQHEHAAHIRRAIRAGNAAWPEQNHYYRDGVSAVKTQTPAVEMNKTLGPGSRQAPKGLAVGAGHAMPLGGVQQQLMQPVFPHPQSPAMLHAGQQLQKAVTGTPLLKRLGAFLPKLR